MAVTGDFDKLRRLRDNLRQFATPAAKAEVAQVLSAAAMKLIADEFRKSQNPYGEAWRPLSWRNGKPLLDTGRMRNAIAPRQLANGFRISIPVEYAPVHQKGGRTRFALVGRRARVGSIPRRQMLPESDTGGLGPIWLDTFNRDVTDLLRRRMAAVA